MIVLFFVVYLLISCIVYAYTRGRYLDKDERYLVSLFWIVTVPSWMLLKLYNFVDYIIDKYTKKD